MAEALLEQNAVSSETLYQFALGLELFQHIQHLRRYVRRDFIYFPQDELEKFGVTDAMLREYRTTPAIQALLAYQVEKIERAFKNASDTLTPVARKSLKPLLIRCEIARQTLHEIRLSEFRVLENFIDLTPVRKAWIKNTLNYTVKL